MSTDIQTPNPDLTTNTPNQAGINPKSSFKNFKGFTFIITIGWIMINLANFIPIQMILLLPQYVWASKQWNLFYASIVTPDTIFKLIGGIPAFILSMLLSDSGNTSLSTVKRIILAKVYVTFYFLAIAAFGISQLVIFQTSNPSVFEGGVVPSAIPVFYVLAILDVVISPIVAIGVLITCSNTVRLATEGEKTPLIV